MGSDFLFLPSFTKILDKNNNQPPKTTLTYRQRSFPSSLKMKAFSQRFNSTWLCTTIHSLKKDPKGKPYINGTLKIFLNHLHAADNHKPVELHSVKLNSCHILLTLVSDTKRTPFLIETYL